MSRLSDQAQPAVAKLVQADEDQLFEQLGVRAQAIAQRPELAGSFEPAVTYDQVAMGPLDAVRDIGRRIYRRWEREAYLLVCGQEDEESGDRESLMAAFGIDGSAVAAILAAGLVSQLGLAPAIAAVVAAILVRRFFRPAYEEFCAAWGERLEATA